MVLICRNFSRCMSVNRLTEGKHICGRKGPVKNIDLFKISASCVRFLSCTTPSKTWDQYYDVTYCDTLKVWWSKCLSTTYNAFCPAPLKQGVCQWLWACHKIKFVLPHMENAVGGDKSVRFIWQCLQTRAEGTLQLGSRAIRSAPSFLWQKQPTGVARLSTCYYLNILVQRI